MTYDIPSYFREDIHPSNTIILCGAGISVSPPSNIPLAQTIIDLHQKNIFSAIRNTPIESLLKTSNTFYRAKVLEYCRFEEYFEIFQKYIDSNLSLLKNLLASKCPNNFHRILATIIKKGFTILTTNFDLLIEEAFREITNKKCDVETFIDHRIGIKNTPHGRLIKLHGSNEERGELVTTIQQLSKSVYYMTDTEDWFLSLRELIKGKRIIIMGYSGSDDFDIIPLLNSDQDSSILWLNHGEENTCDEGDIKKKDIYAKIRNPSISFTTGNTETIVRYLFNNYLEKAYKSQEISSSESSGIFYENVNLLTAARFLNELQFRHDKNTSIFAPYFLCNEIGSNAYSDFIDTEMKKLVSNGMQNGVLSYYLSHYAFTDKRKQISQSDYIFLFILEQLDLTVAAKPIRDVLKKWDVKSIWKNIYMSEEIEEKFTQERSCLSGKLMLSKGLFYEFCLYVNSFVYKLITPFADWGVKNVEIKEETAKVIKTAVHMARNLNLENIIWSLCCNILQSGLWNAILSDSDKDFPFSRCTFSNRKQKIGTITSMLNSNFFSKNTVLREISSYIVFCKSFYIELYERFESAINVYAIMSSSEKLSDWMRVIRIIRSTVCVGIEKDEIDLFDPIITYVQMRKSAKKIVRIKGITAFTMWMGLMKNYKNYLPDSVTERLHKLNREILIAFGITEISKSLQVFNDCHSLKNAGLHDQALAKLYGEISNVNSKDLKSDFYEEIADNLISKREVGMAKKILLEILSEKPGLGNANYLLGFIYILENDVGKALKCFELAKEYGSGSMEVDRNIFWCYVQTKKYHNAVELVKKYRDLIHLDWYWAWDICNALEFIREHDKKVCSDLMRLLVPVGGGNDDGVARVSKLYKNAAHRQESDELAYTISLYLKKIAGRTTGLTPQSPKSKPKSDPR